MYCIYAQGYVHALQSIREYLLHKIFYADLELNKRMQFKVKKNIYQYIIWNHILR